MRSIEIQFLFYHLTENLAYGTRSEQSSTKSQLGAQLAVDGLPYTCSLTQLAFKVSLSHHHSKFNSYP